MPKLICECQPCQFLELESTVLYHKWECGFFSPLESVDNEVVGCIANSLL